MPLGACPVTRRVRGVCADCIGWKRSKVRSAMGECALRRVEAHVEGGEGVDLLESAGIADATPLGACPVTRRVRGVCADCIGWKWSKVNITDLPRVEAWVKRVRARPAVERGLAYGVPKDEIDQWSEERKAQYRKGGSSIASNEKLRSEA